MRLSGAAAAAQVMAAPARLDVVRTHVRVATGTLLAWPAAMAMVFVDIDARVRAKLAAFLSAVYAFEQVVCSLVADLANWSVHGMLPASS